jgi:hypothetical protein
MLSPRPKRAKNPDNREDSVNCPAFFAGFFLKNTLLAVWYFLKKG